MGAKERFTSRPMLKKMILAKINTKEISYEVYDIVDRVLGEFLESMTVKAEINRIRTHGKRLDRRDYEAALGMEIVDLPNRKCLKKKYPKIKPSIEVPVDKEEAELDVEEDDTQISSEPIVIAQPDTTALPLPVPETSTVPNEM